MNKKTLSAVLLAGVLLAAGCGNKAETTTAAAAQTTTTAAETTTAATTTAAETTATTASETTAAEETTASETEKETKEEEEKEEEDTGSEEEEEEDGEEAEEEEGEDAASFAPYGETVLESGVEVSLDAAFEASKAVMESGTYTFEMDSTVEVEGTTQNVTAVYASDPELGKFTYMDMMIIKMKTIANPDGTITIIDDDNKLYVNTTAEESGTTVGDADLSSMVSTDGSNISNADLVQFPDGSVYCRFISTSESEDGGSDIYIYASDETGLLSNIATVTDEAVSLADIYILDTVDPSYFEIPEDYEEVSYEEYQEKLMESMFGGLGLPSEGEEGSDEGEYEEYEEYIGSENNEE